MWNLKCFVAAVIYGASGIVSKELKYLEIIPEQHSTDYLQEKRLTRNITHRKESATI
jgi:hypothetical protein